MVTARVMERASVTAMTKASELGWKWDKTWEKGEARAVAPTEMASGMGWAMELGSVLGMASRSVSRSQSKSIAGSRK
jgi:hypothetical protein